MKPSTLTIFQLFESERRFVVPLFQRPYVWGLDRQWRPLWEDITAKADDILAHDDQSNHRLRKHFMGAVVLNQIRTFGRQLSAAEVIDGQQRLTTLQILLVALRDFVKAIENKQPLRRLERVTENDTGYEKEYEKYKVWPTTTDRIVFEDVFTRGSPEALQSKYPLERRKFTRKYLPRPRLAEAYFFFYQAISDYVQPEQDQLDSATMPPDNSFIRNTSSRERLESLVSAITQYLELVVIELEDGDDPQVIFETLNARGEPLLPSDLIRNFVFLEASRQQKDVDALYRTYWQPYDQPGASGEDFWKASERQGRLTRPRMDLFFFHYLSYRAEHDLLITHLFQEFRDWWDKQPRDVDFELSTLQDYSNVFRSLFDGSATGRLQVFARRMRVLDTSTVYPFLLFLLVEHDETIPMVERDAILQNIESYLVRRIVCGLTTKNYNRVFPQLLRQMRKANVVNQVTVRRFFTDLQGDTVRWPTDEEFRSAWLSNPVYQWLTVRRVLMVLEAIDLQLMTAKQEQIHLSGDLSIEHVMPQNGSTHDWPLADESVLGDDPMENRSRLIHTFGNLTILTQKLNSSISNGPFIKKRPEITKNSSLRLNTYFQSFDGTSWTEQDIIDRGEWLFAIAKDVWPGPASLH